MSWKAKHGKLTPGPPDPEGPSSGWRSSSKGGWWPPTWTHTYSIFANRWHKESAIDDVIGRQVSEHAHSSPTTRPTDWLIRRKLCVLEMSLSKGQINDCVACKLVQAVAREVYAQHACKHHSSWPNRQSTLASLIHYTSSCCILYVPLIYVLLLFAPITTPAPPAGSAFPKVSVPLGGGFVSRWDICLLLNACPLTSWSWSNVQAEPERRDKI